MHLVGFWRPFRRSLPLVVPVLGALAGLLVQGSGGFAQLQPPADECVLSAALPGTEARLEVRPEVAQARSPLTYCLYIGEGLRQVGVTVRAVLHLPPGATEASGRAAGYICGVRDSQPDRFQSEPHPEVECVSAVSGVPPGVLRVTATSPAAPGAWRVCVEVDVRRASRVTCTRTTVIAR